MEFRPTQSTAAERKVRDDATATPRPFEGGYWVREGRCDKDLTSQIVFVKNFRLIDWPVKRVYPPTKVSKEVLWAFWKAPQFRGS